MPKNNIVDIERMREIESIDSDCRKAHDALLTPEAIHRRQLRTFPMAGALVEVSGMAPDVRVGRVYGFGFFEEATEAALDAIIEILAREQVTRIRFRVAPTHQRADIMAWLSRRGMKRSLFVVQWVASTEPERSVETEFAIQPLRPEDAGRFGQIIAINYRLKAPDSAAFHARLAEIPGMSCAMAFDGISAIGTGALYRKGAGCILEYGTTLAPYRKQGLQCAMIGYRLNEAARLGCSWACASTIGCDRSSRNLRRQGFVKAYDEIVFA
jgi:hypothetical protein